MVTNFCLDRICAFKRSVDINQIPLTESIPGLSKAAYADHAHIEPFDTKLTILDSGLRVASEPHYGQYCTIGVSIDSGSRYEVGYPSGTSHFIEKLAFSVSYNSLVIVQC
ncbi:unnamed protein product [Toxocara canis]|uniref:Peptidase_M16 domain-containing protein n=1 Tax=Toxocara canis TaxID=6265 RepID=A0A183V138_TOXCA|nr:unnamed protein product [Toxocara canis]